MKYLIFLLMAHAIMGYLPNAFANQVFDEKFINTFLIYYGGGDDIKEEDLFTLANYDLIAIDRFRFDDVNKNTWSELKKINKKSRIFLYQGGPIVLDSTDGLEIYYLNNIGRYNNGRNHFMGSINHSRSAWFLTNKTGIVLTMNNNPSEKVLDFGDKKFQQYWLLATVNDIVEQPWKADGIKIDNCSTYEANDKLQSVRYPDVESWDIALNSYVEGVTKGLHDYGQLVMVNRTGSHLPSGEKAWIKLDSSNTPPDVVMDEGAFSVSWTSKAVSFHSPSSWLRQMEMPKKIRKSSVAYISHTNLAPGEKGLDSKGNSVTFEQIFRYALGSYLLAKRSNPVTLFSFDYNRDEGDYKRISWMDIYRTLDLGSALGEVKVVRDGKQSVYAREFEKGYVYVNPTYSTVKKVPLPAEPVSIMDIHLDGTIYISSNVLRKEFSVPPHHAVYLYKRN